MKRPPHFEIKRTVSGALPTLPGTPPEALLMLPWLRSGWYFRIVAPNGKILAHSEVYERLASAKKACRAINPKLEILVIR
jgi:hypothetical protein